MENYERMYILAFVRFACRLPKMITPDEGSQLVNGCQDININSLIIQNKLNVDYGVKSKTFLVALITFMER